MADINKIIKALDFCMKLEDGQPCSVDCPYFKSDCHGYDRIMLDVQRILKKQRREKPETGHVEKFVSALESRLKHCPKEGVGLAISKDGAVKLLGELRGLLDERSV